MSAALILARAEAEAADFLPERIILQLDQRLSAALSQAAVDEAAALWRPYAIAICSFDTPTHSCRFGAGVAARLTVMIDDTPDDVDRWAVPLATIRFGSDGRPDDEVLLHYRALTQRFSAAVSEVDGIRAAQWPAALRERVMGRVIGRVIAHETGHWLLLKRQHSASGLMRGDHGMNELADASRRPFALAAEDVRRLATMALSRPAIVGDPVTRD